MVSAHCAPDVNDLVSSALTQHRERREEVDRDADRPLGDPPVPAAGYQLPMAVDNPTDAAKLAVRMEDDTAVAWRAVLEQAQQPRTGRSR